MGLDLTVTLKDVNENGILKSEICQSIINNTLASNDDARYNGMYSKYYRLNWSGVRTEREFMYAIQFFNLSKAERNALLVSKTRIKKKGVYLVEGETNGRFSKTKYGFQKVVMGYSIKREKRNLIRIGAKGKYTDVNFISKYKIYELHSGDYDFVRVESHPSVVDLISLNRWEGSNGEVYVLQWNNEGHIVANSVARRYVDENDDEGVEEVTPLISISKPFLINSLIQDVDDIVKSLEYFLTNVTEQHYIARNNLTLALMLQKFLQNKDTELVSYYG